MISLSLPQSIEELFNVAQRMDELALTAPNDVTWEDIFKQVRGELNERLGQLRVAQADA